MEITRYHSVLDRQLRPAVSFYGLDNQVWHGIVVGPACNVYTRH